MLSTYHFSIHSLSDLSGFHKFQDSTNTRMNEKSRVLTLIRDSYGSAPHLWLAKEELHMRRARKFRRSVQRQELEEVSTKQEELGENCSKPAEEGHSKFS